MSSKFYNAENQILGRLCTSIAKDLLKGEKVFVVNSEKAVLSGNPKWKTKFYAKRYERGDPIHGPFFPKQPDRIFRRTVRGMLPWHKSGGRTAYRNLKVFIGVPDELKSKSFEKVSHASADRLKIKFITLEDLSLAIGAKKRW